MYRSTDATSISIMPGFEEPLISPFANHLYKVDTEMPYVSMTVRGLMYFGCSIGSPMWCAAHPIATRFFHRTRMQPRSSSANAVRKVPV